MRQAAGKGGGSLSARRLFTGFNRLIGRGYRSAGVPVSGAVHAVIVLGNRARAIENWKDAARHYEAALRRAPHLSHIWMQLGHMHKQLGNYDRAAEAYARAEALAPDLTEAAVEQGHIAKLQKRGDLAVQHYLRAYQSGDRNPDALRELLILLEHGSGANRDALARALKLDRLNGAPRRQIAALPSQPLAGVDGEEQAIVFDASDLISYFGNARLPTGIQRVQIATILGAIESRSPGSVIICSFSDQADSWSEVPADTFVELCRLALQSGDRSDPEWLDAYTRLKIDISLAPPLAFPFGAFLVNLGTSWWLQNYFMFVREAKRLYGIRYIPFVHDFIPIMTPEHCVTQLTQDFITWALGVFQHADFFLVNSQATRRDLLKVAGLLGHEVNPDVISVIPLDARFRASDAPVASNARLQDWDLVENDFVLIVSTIESRKNHIGALDAWLALIEKHGADAIPKLVCVGNKGWLNDAVYARIGESRSLRSRVLMLSGLSDEELGLLYKSCRFTLYPSNYEGWGLPVTESLCFGKVPLISDSSSLPEAGGSFAIYFQAGSTEDLTDKAEALIFDEPERRRLEDVIEAEFRPREWEEVAGQIGSEIGAFVARDQGRQPSSERIEPVRLGAHYPIVRNFETRIWSGLGLAEIYRSGTGWWWPDDWGCWIKPGGADLAMRFPEQKGPLRGYVQLHAPPDYPCRFSITVPEVGLAIEDVLMPDEIRWVAFDLQDIVPSDGIHIHFVGSAAVDLSEKTGDLDCRVISLGVFGFYFCHANDLVARADFLEALTIGGLKRLAFNKEAAIPGKRVEEGMEEW